MGRELQEAEDLLPDTLKFGPLQRRSQQVVASGGSHMDLILAKHYIDLLQSDLRRSELYIERNSLITSEAPK